MFSAQLSHCNVSDSSASSVASSSNVLRPINCVPSYKPRNRFIATGSENCETRTDTPLVRSALAKHQVPRYRTAVSLATSNAELFYMDIADV